MSNIKLRLLNDGGFDLAGLQFPVDVEALPAMRDRFYVIPVRQLYDMGVKSNEMLDRCQQRDGGLFFWPGEECELVEAE